jgi:hypothetical protein
MGEAESYDHLPAKPPMWPAIGLLPTVINTDRERRLLSVLIALVPLLVA